MADDTAAGHQASQSHETASGWASEFLDNLQRASDEALEIFYSAFNVSAQAPANANAEAQGLGWGSVNKEGEGRKQFYFGDPADYDLSEINGPRSQVGCLLLGTCSGLRLLRHCYRPPLGGLVVILPLPMCSGRCSRAISRGLCKRLNGASHG